MSMLNVSAETVAQRLRAARMLAGIDQTEMGRRLGVTRTTVSNWERGATEPSVSQFISWAHETKQPVNLLIDGLPGVARLEGLEPPTFWLGVWSRVRAALTPRPAPFWTPARRHALRQLEIDAISPFPGAVR